MTDSLITVQGYVGTTPTLRRVGQHVVASFRIASTPRRLVRSTGEWQDGETQWYSVSAWRTLGENAAASLHKGDPVFVHGRLSVRTWTGRDGVDSTTFEIDAMTVGHDLNRVCTGTVRRTKASGEERREGSIGMPPYDAGPAPEPAPEPAAEQSEEGAEERLQRVAGDWAIPGTVPAAADPWAEPIAEAEVAVPVGSAA